MVNFIKEHWKPIIIALLSLLLIVTSFLLYRQIQETRELKVYISQMDTKIELLEKVLKANNEIYEKNAKLIEQLNDKLDKDKEVIITNKTEYDKVKKSPIKRVSDAELNKYIKSLESDINARKNSKR